MTYVAVADPDVGTGEGPILRQVTEEELVLAVGDVGPLAEVAEALGRTVVC